MEELQKPDSSGMTSILADIPGGSELLEWFDNEPGFHDAEVISLCLDRAGQSNLRVAICKPYGNGQWKTAVVTMILKDMIDVSIEGFSHQNVIGGLTISHNDKTPSGVHPSLLGIGAGAPDHRIELRPCAGAFGTILATIAEISLEDRADAFRWQKGI
jgi:hypothetical protein